jgi:hypothetical protein
LDCPISWFVLTFLVVSDLSPRRPHYQIALRPEFLLLASNVCRFGNQLSIAECKRRGNGERTAALLSEVRVDACRHNSVYNSAELLSYKARKFD